MDSENIRKFMASSGDHIDNLNYALKSIKSNIIINFIHSNHWDFIVILNKVVFSSDLSIVENYVKNTSSMDSNNVQTAQLTQSKSYLKILDIPYIIKDTNISINLSVVEKIIKFTHIFDNICITSKPCIVKVSPKSDMAIY